VKGETNKEILGTPRCPGGEQKEYKRLVELGKLADEFIM
jgi:hypothetical protein